MDFNHISNLFKIFCWFLWWKDDGDILAHSLLGLSYILPAVELKIENKGEWDRVTGMLTHNTTLVKRASLNCLNAIARSNEMQCQYIIENNAVGLVGELLNFNNVLIKQESCEFLALIASMGYANVRKYIFMLEEGKRNFWKKNIDNNVSNTFN